MLAFERDAIKLHAVIDQTEAEPLGYLSLQRFKLGLDELEQRLRDTRTTP